MDLKEFVIYGTPPHGLRQKVGTVYADPARRTAIKERLETLNEVYPDSEFEVQRQ